MRRKLILIISFSILLFAIFTTPSQSVRPITPIECFAWFTALNIPGNMEEVCDPNVLFYGGSVPLCDFGTCMALNDFECGSGICYNEIIRPLESGEEISCISNLDPWCGDSCFIGCPSPEYFCDISIGQCIIPPEPPAPDDPDPEPFECILGQTGACYGYEYASCESTLLPSTNENSQKNYIQTDDCINEDCVCVMCNLGYEWDSANQQCIPTCLTAGGIPNFFNNGCSSFVLSEPYDVQINGDRWCELQDPSTPYCIGCCDSECILIQLTEDVYICEFGCSLKEEYCETDIDCCDYPDIPKYGCNFNKCSCISGYELDASGVCIKIYPDCSTLSYFCFHNTDNPYDCIVSTNYNPESGTQIPCTTCCNDCMGLSDYHCEYPIEIY